LIITTNLNLGEWSQVFGDAKMATAMLDRNTHASCTVNDSRNSQGFILLVTIHAPHAKMIPIWEKVMVEACVFRLSVG